jgi:hypothetical protein
MKRLTVHDRLVFFRAGLYFFLFEHNKYRAYREFLRAFIGFLEA